MATDLRLFMMVAASSVSFGVTYVLLDNCPAKVAVAWATGAGFVLSCDTVTLLGRLVSGCSRGVKVAPLLEDGAASPPPAKPPPLPVGPRALIDALVLGGSVVAALLCNSIELDDDKVDILDGMVWALWGIGEWRLRRTFPCPSCTFCAHCRMNSETVRKQHPIPPPPHSMQQRTMHPRATYVGNRQKQVAAAIVVVVVAVVVVLVLES